MFSLHRAVYDISSESVQRAEDISILGVVFEDSFPDIECVMAVVGQEVRVNYCVAVYNGRYGSQDHCRQKPSAGAAPYERWDVY